MRHKLIQIIFIPLVFLIYQEIYSQETVLIYGKVVNPKSNFINISAPVDNLTSWAITKKITLDNSGNFSFRYETSKIGFYDLWHEIAPFHNVSAKLLLNSGDSCYVEINTAKQSIDIHSNNNQAGLKLYNQLNSQIQELEINAENKFRKYTSHEINDTIIKSKNSKLKELQELYKKGDIEQSFLNLTIQEITYRYAVLYYDLIGHIVFMSEGLPEEHPQYFKQSEESLLFADSTLSQLFSQMESVPLKSIERSSKSTIPYQAGNSEIIFSNSYLKLLEKYIHYKGYYQPQRNKTFDLSKVDNNFHKYNLDLYSKYLNEREFEYGVSSYFYSWFQKQNLAEGLVKPFYSFKKYYPNNPFIPYIDSIAEEYNLFKNISITNFSENINIIAGADTINSFEDLLSNFDGQALYIDIWATTCPPCLKEFDYYSDLYKFLSLNDISILFISFDKPSEIQHWKKTINKYNLIGYHILANRNLENDIKRKTKMIGLPWYCFKDREGNLSGEFIYRPSSKEKLHEQINDFIKE